MARITVVNDNPEFLELMEAILEDERYQTTAIDGGRPDALEAVLDSRPDLLIIDVRLGVGARGWSIAKQARTQPELAELPVLLCSGDLVALDDVRDDVDAASGVETLVKPFEVDELTAAVERLLGAADHPPG